MDNNMPLSKDFSKELDNRIEHELKQNKKKKGVVRSSVALTIIIAFSFLIVAYVNFLDLLYEDEQAKLKAAQGEYYYSKTFKEYIFVPEEHMLILNMEEEAPKMSFYGKIRYHKVVND